MKGMEMRFCAVLLNFCSWGLISATQSQSDSAGKWNFSMFADVYLGRNYTVSENVEQSISELVSFHRFNEVTLNTGFAVFDYLDSTKRFSAGAGIGTYMQRNMATEPMGYRNVLQCYGGVKLSHKGSLWLDAGIMPSHIGYESAISMDQPTLTRSLVSDFSPYYETGIKLSGLHKNVNFSALWLNGWQRIWRNSQELGNHVGVQAQYSPGKFLFNYSGFYGGLGQSNAGTERFFHDIYVKLVMGRRISLWMLLDYGTDHVNGNQNSWWGSAAVLRCKLNDRTSISARLEHFSDPYKRIVLSAVKPAEITGFSINGDFQLTEGVLFRVELKQLNASEYIFFNANSTFTQNSLQGLASIAWKLIK